MAGMTHGNAGSEQRPEALLLLAPGCPHCAGVLASLGDLVKEGVIGRLEVINIMVQPERAAALGARSVPWLRIGEFELVGAHSAAELRRWVERAGTEAGMSSYFRDLLGAGDRQRVETMVQSEPDRLALVLELLVDPDAGINVRVGAGAVLEALQHTGLLARAVPKLGALTAAPDPRVRADACHYLSLTDNRAAVPYLRACLRDPDADVREIARESLAALAAPGPNPA